jgi:hypothetical protein
MILAHRAVETQAAAGAAGVRENFHLRETREAGAVHRVFPQGFSANRALGGKKEIDESAPKRTHAQKFTGYV